MARAAQQGDKQQQAGQNQQGGTEQNAREAGEQMDRASDAMKQARD